MLDPYVPGGIWPFNTFGRHATPFSLERVAITVLVLWQLISRAIGQPVFHLAAAPRLDLNSVVPNEFPYHLVDGRVIVPKLIDIEKYVKEEHPTLDDASRESLKKFIEKEYEGLRTENDVVMFSLEDGSFRSQPVKLLDKKEKTPFNTMRKISRRWLAGTHHDPHAANRDLGHLGMEYENGVHENPKKRFKFWSWRTLVLADFWTWLFTKISRLFRC